MYSIVNATDGGFALCGITRSVSQSVFDVWLVKINALGSIEWNSTYEAANDERANSLIETADGGYLVAGSTNSFGSGGTDFLLVKFGPDLLAPELGTPSQNPSRINVQPLQTVAVSVNATDVESGVKNVTLFHSLDNGTTWNAPIPMNINTTSGLYQGTIPGQSINTAVRFKIVAFDKAGNSITKDETSFNYTYMVVPEFPTVITTMSFLTILALTLLLAKRRLIKTT